MHRNLESRNGALTLMLWRSPADPPYHRPHTPAKKQKSITMVLSVLSLPLLDNCIPKQHFI